LGLICSTGAVAGQIGAFGNALVMAQRSQHYHREKHYRHNQQQVILEANDDNKRVIFLQAAMVSR